MLTKIFSLLGLGPSKQQLQKNEEMKKSELSGAVELKDMNASGGNRRHSKRNASKRNASKRNASKRKCKASRRK
jgi:hypothetical protein